MLAAARRIHTSLRTKLVLLVVLAILPAFVVALYSHLERRSEAGERVHQDALAAAYQITHAQQELLARTESLLIPLARLLALSRSGDLTGIERATCDPFLASLLTDATYANIGVVAADGTVVCSAVTTNGPVDLSDRTYIRQALATGSFAVGEYQVGRITDIATLNVGYPIIDASGVPIGVVFAAIDLAALTHFGEGLQLPPGSALTFTDAQGTVLLRDPDGEEWQGRSGRSLPGVAAVLGTSEAGTARGPGLDGQDRLFAFAPLLNPDGAVSAVVHVGIPSDLAFTAANTTLWRSLFGLGVATALAVAIAAFGGGALLVRPVQAFEHVTRRVAEGDLAARVGPGYPDDELGRLGHSIDVMAIALQDRRAQVRQLTADLEQRVALRTAELEAANAELEAFSYSVSHDLRAPLRAIDGFSMTLLRDYGGQLDDRGRDRLDRVRAAAQRLAALIDDLLQLSRATRVEMRRQTVDLTALARALASELREGDPERIVELEIAAGLEVEGDPTLLRAVLQNLLANAWKFTSQHHSARIAFGAIDEDGERVFYVRDDGAGFDLAYSAKLFSPFQRLHAAAEFEGNGIGLATVQRIIRRHGGRVWAAGAVEQGATIYFTIPSLTPRAIDAVSKAA